MHCARLICGCRCKAVDGSVDGRDLAVRQGLAVQACRRIGKQALRVESRQVWCGFELAHHKWVTSFRNMFDKKQKDIHNVLSI